jgi:hypothetical protein
MATLIGVLVVVGIAVVWLVSALSLRGIKRPRGERGVRGTSQIHAWWRDERRH